MAEEISNNLHRVLKPEAEARWLRTSVPDLGGLTPEQALNRGEWEAVVALTRSYLETSFS